MIRVATGADAEAIYELLFAARDEIPLTKIATDPRNDWLDFIRDWCAYDRSSHRKPPSQGWKTFLHNHADGIASIDLFVVPTLSFRLLFGLLIMLHGRRIHGELLKLGIEIRPNLDRQVYGKHRRPPSQGWRTFLRNHAGRAHSGLARLMSRIRRRISSGTFGLHHRHQPTNAAVAQSVVPHHLEYRRNSHEIRDL